MIVAILESPGRKIYLQLYGLMSRSISSFKPPESPHNAPQGQSGPDHAVLCPDCLSPPLDLPVRSFFEADLDKSFSLLIK